MRVKSCRLPNEFRQGRTGQRRTERRGGRRVYSCRNGIPPYFWILSPIFPSIFLSFPLTCNFAHLQVSIKDLSADQLSSLGTLANKVGHFAVQPTTTVNIFFSLSSCLQVLKFFDDEKKEAEDQKNKSAHPVHVKGTNLWALETRRRSNNDFCLSCSSQQGCILTES